MRFYYLVKFFKRIIYTFFAKLTLKGKQGKIKAFGPTKFSKNTSISENGNFNGFKVYGNGKLSIGKNFHSGINCRVITDIHNYDSGITIPYDSKIISKNIVIEDNVWLGNDVLILGGVKISEGAIIQAGSVVVKNVPACGIAGGNPAQVFKYRDKEHYYKLKSEGKFH